MNITSENASQNVSMEVIRRNPHLRWNRSLLSHNRDLGADFLELDLSNAIGKWDYEHLSSNISIDYILAHPNLPWNWAHISLSYLIEDRHIEDLKKYIPVYMSMYLSSESLWVPHIDTRRRRGYAGVGMVLLDVEHLDVDIEIFADSLPFDYVLKHRLGIHNRSDIFSHPGVTLEKIRQVYTLSDEVLDEIAPYIPIQEIRDNTNLSWNLEEVSSNPGMTIADLYTLSLENMRNDWDWSNLSRVIPIDEIRANPQFPWEPLSVMRNPQVTVADVEAMLGV